LNTPGNITKPLVLQAVYHDLCSTHLNWESEKADAGKVRDRSSNFLTIIKIIGTIKKIDIKMSETETTSNQQCLRVLGFTGKKMLSEVRVMRISQQYL
jgi:hypothetical protein